MKKIRLVLVLLTLMLLVGCEAEKKNEKTEKQIKENKKARKSAYDFMKKFEEKGKKSYFNKLLGERNK